MPKINVKGTSLVHSYNMMTNLQYAVRVKDDQFFDNVFPAFFETLGKDQLDDLCKAFKNKTVVVTKGEQDGDAILEY